MRAKPMEAQQWILNALSSDTNDCLIWPFAKLKNGYGQIGTKAGTARLHRYICEKAHGAPPSSIHEAAHRCGNRPCGNPKHLRWATPKENHADQVEHGTINRGHRHGQVKLAESDIPQIRASKSTFSALSRQYGVSPATIRDVITRKTWAWVSDTNFPSP